MDFNVVKFVHVALALFSFLSPSFSVLVSDITVSLSNVNQDTTHANSGYVYFENIGILGCVKKCLQKRNCLSFTHSKETLNCELFDRILSSSDLKFEKRSVYSERTSWIQEALNGCGSLECDELSSCFTNNGSSICLPSECSSTPPIIPNGVIAAVDQRMGLYAQYQCDGGMYLEGTPRRACMATGAWQSDQFTCHLQCPPAPIIPDASLDDPFRIVGIFTNYTCVNDTVLFGTPSLFCQPNQTWTNVHFECIRQCPVAPTITDATFNETERILGTVVQYTCDAVADLFGTPILTCQHNQTWTTVTFQCVRQCPIAPNITYASTDTEVRSVGTSVTYTCGNDTMLSGTSTITCQTDQTWTSVQFSCLEQCPSTPPDVPYAEANLVSRLIDDVMIYTCIDKYDAVGSQTVTCQSNRTWSSVNFDCHKACAPPPLVAYATPIPGSKFIDDTISYKCDSDFVVRGTPNITCQIDQSWTALDFQCHLECPVAPTITDATSKETERILGTVVQYTCDVVADLFGTPILTCQHNQTWTTVTFQCVRQCPIAPNVTYASTDTEVRSVGTSVTYTCGNDTMLSGTSTITCQTDQTWTSVQFSCLEPCPIPPIVPNTTYVSGEKFVGDTVLYTCDQGYGVIGTPNITCQNDLTWTNIEFQCKTVCPEPVSKDNASVYFIDKFVGSNATYTCYNQTTSPVSGTLNVTCQFNQTWTETNFTCDGLT